MSDYKKTALVLGAGGFIGSHMVKRLRSEGYWVRGVDLKHLNIQHLMQMSLLLVILRESFCCYDVFVLLDTLETSIKDIVDKFAEPFDEIYQFAADMGGAGLYFTGENDADIMHNSVSINLNVLEEQRKLNEITEQNKTKIFLLWIGMYVSRA